jgi:hypothetical protein
MELPTLTVRWKKYDSTEYYSFNPETGVLYILVNLEQQKGYIVRNDPKAGEMLRKYHNEIYQGVPDEHRLFAECDGFEYAKVWSEVVDYTNNSFRRTIQETF